MKFIGGIHTFTFEDDAVTIKLPHYHRSSTGLISNTTVYLYPRRTSKDKIREVVISPFHPMSWSDIWKLELTSIDRPGLIKDITKILRNEKVNISIQESLITNYNQDFTVSLIADFRDYFEKHNLTIKKKITPEEVFSFYEKIKVIFDKFNNDIPETEKTKKIEIERFEPIKFLINNSKEIINSPENSTGNLNLVHRERLNHYYHPNYSGKNTNNRSVLIDKKLLTDLSLKKFSGNSECIQGTLFSDTEEKFIIVRFFSSEQLIVHLEITHESLPGAINEFTEKINEADKNFNVISCYNRVKNDRDTALWYVLIDVTSNPRKVKNLVEELRNISDPSKVEEVKILSYSNSLWDNKLKENFELEESEEQKEFNNEKQSSDEKQLKLLRDLLSKEKLLLKNLNRDEEQIEIHVDREIKNTLIIFSILIIFFLICIITLVLLVRWELLEPWMSAGPSIISGIAALYALYRGIDLRLPQNNEETRNKIKEKWLKIKGYKITGENTFDNQMAVRNKEIEKIENDISSLERKLLK